MNCKPKTLSLLNDIVYVLKSFQNGSSYSVLECMDMVESLIKDVRQVEPSHQPDLNSGVS